MEWIIKEMKKFKLFDKAEEYPKDKISEREVYELAKFLHIIYEKASKDVNWKTQEDCQVDFHKLPDNNRKVMMIVSNILLNVIYRDFKKLKVKTDGTE